MIPMVWVNCPAGASDSRAIWKMTSLPQRLVSIGWVPEALGMMSRKRITAMEVEIGANWKAQRRRRHSAVTRMDFATRLAVLHLSGMQPLKLCTPTKVAGLLHKAGPGFTHLSTFELRPSGLNFPGRLKLRRAMIGSAYTTYTKEIPRSP